MAAFKLTPGMAALVTGLTDEWAKLDNGRVVVIVGPHPAGGLVVRPFIPPDEFHTRSNDGTVRKRNGLAIVHERFLMPICPARELNYRQ